MKLFAGLLALMLLIGGASFLAFRAAPSGLECAQRVVAEAPSPDGKFVAALYEQRCGETVTTHVALRMAQAAFVPRGDVVVLEGAAQARLSWREKELLVETAAPRVALHEPSWRTVTVRLVRVR